MCVCVYLQWKGLFVYLRGYGLECLEHSGSNTWDTVLMFIMFPCLCPNLGATGTPVPLHQFLSSQLFSCPVTPCSFKSYLFLLLGISVRMVLHKTLGLPLMDAKSCLHSSQQFIFRDLIFLAHLFLLDGDIFSGNPPTDLPLYITAQNHTTGLPWWRSG